MLPLLLLLACDKAPEPAPADAPQCADHDPLRRPFFGDTHVHTTLSLDAHLQGTRLGPADAYAFAKGAEVGIQPHAEDGTPLRRLRLSRPLDFVAVSDHAEFLGTIAACRDPSSPAYDEPGCVTFRDRPDTAFLTLNANTAIPPDSVNWPPLCGDDGVDCIEAGAEVWQQVISAAEAANDPTDACTFAAFPAYEWSGGPGTKNLHRNVIFEGSAVPDRAVSYFDSPQVPGLWAALQSECLDQPDCDVLTIPHNSNLSDGLMFQTVDDDLSADPAQLRVRAQMEPLVEVFQHKGDSECAATAADELCSFEKVPYNTLSGANLDAEGEPQPQDFVRRVLGEGLRYAAEHGVNPYRYGIVASTDTHIAAAGAVDEATFPGHGGAGSNNRDAITGLPDNPLFSPGGLAVLWATERSRPALFAAMKRREAYGTSGPRIVLRVYGGDLPDDLCDRVDALEIAEARGVPMGGTLPAGPARFWVIAEADPGDGVTPSVPLERLQLIRGRLDGEVVTTDVIDIAGAADPTASVTESCEPTGAGAARLCAVWEDVDHTDTTAAFWYARVVEVPTCRWQTHTCRAAGITCPTDDPAWAGCCDERAEVTLQERAWSSPIWSSAVP